MFLTNVLNETLENHFRCLNWIKLISNLCWLGSLLMCTVHSKNDYARCPFEFNILVSQQQWHNLLVHAWQASLATLDILNQNIPLT